MARELAVIHPDAHCELDFTNAFELLVATVLSAQTTDKMVNKVTPTLFAKYPDAVALAGADRDELEQILKPTGFFRAKANSVLGLSQALVERFDGEVPGRMADLVTLPGRRPQDRERRPRQRLRRPGAHRGHALRPAGPPVRLDGGGGPGQGRGRDRRAGAEEGVDRLQPPRDLPRPPGLPRQEGRLRRLRAGRRGARRTGSGRSIPRSR